MQESEKLLEIKNAMLGYRSGSKDRVLVDDINLSVQKGELIALIGKNGSGKTTLLKNCIRLNKLISGEILLKNKDINIYSPNELAKLAGFVSTFFSDQTEMTVEELVRIGRFPYTNLFGVLSETDKKYIRMGMDICGISHLKERKINLLSDGEKQRSMLARVFAQNTELILLDEPTSFLDIPNKFEIFSLLKDLSSKGKSIIFATHDLDLASKYVDKLWLINNSRITEGAPEDLFLGNEIIEQFTTRNLEINKKTGSFVPRIQINKYARLISCNGCKLAELWTKKALLRNGIGVTSDTGSKNHSTIEINISKEKDKFVWNLQKDNQNLSVTSIYQLIAQLKNLFNHDPN